MYRYLVPVLLLLSPIAASAQSDSTAARRRPAPDSLLNKLRAGGIRADSIRADSIRAARTRAEGTRAERTGAERTGADSVQTQSVVYVRERHCHRDEALAGATIGLVTGSLVGGALGAVPASILSVLKKHRAARTALYVPAAVGGIMLGFLFGVLGMTACA